MGETCSGTQHISSATDDVTDPTMSNTPATASVDTVIGPSHRTCTPPATDDENEQLLPLGYKICSETFMVLHGIGNTFNNNMNFITSDLINRGSTATLPRKS